MYLLRTAAIFGSPFCAQQATQCGMLVVQHMSHTEVASDCNVKSKSGLSALLNDKDGALIVSTDEYFLRRHVEPVCIPVDPVSKILVALLFQLRLPSCFAFSIWFAMHGCFVLSFWTSRSG